MSTLLIIKLKDSDPQPNLPQDFISADCQPDRDILVKTTPGRKINPTVTSFDEASEDLHHHGFPLFCECAFN